MDSQVLKGNCFEVLPSLPKSQFQTAFLDPPYNIGLDYGNGRKADKLPSEDYLSQMAELFGSRHWYTWTSPHGTVA